MPSSHIARGSRAIFNLFSRRGSKATLRRTLCDCPPPCDACKTGFKQSPIEICDGNTKPIQLPPLSFSNHFVDDVSLCMFLSDDMINLVPTGIVLSVKGGPLSDTFLLENCHLHWGCQEDEGSEHSINKKKYAMEAHLKYYNCIYGSFSKAVNQPEGIACISVLMEAMPGTRNKDFDTVVKCLPFLVPGKSTPLSKNVFKMFKHVLESPQYYTYEGSSTIPPCCEEVTWIVFKDPLCIDCYQVEPFRKLCNSKNEMITENWRDIQPLNGRKIYQVTSCPAPEDDCE